MHDAQLKRFSRHILLPEIDVPGQEKLLASRALIVGLGGLGSPVAMYLAASGIGHLALCDDDVVELTNLQRQIVHRNRDIGRHKVDSAADSLREIDPAIRITPLKTQLAGPEMHAEAARADVVIDASDNFATRFALNEACAILKKPLISGSVIGFTGQVTVFRTDQCGPCYRCLFPDGGTPDEETCSQRGVLAPAAGLTGCIQAIEALKVMLGMAHTLAGRLLHIDAKHMRFRETVYHRDPHCPVCARS